MSAEAQNLDNKISVNETPYAVAKLGESARIIKQSINELPLLRRRLEKNKSVKLKAREIYGDLQNQYRRLINAFDTVALSLLEAEHDEMASHSVKLSQAVRAFNPMTPDYTKLCAALSGYLSKLPLSDLNEASDILNISANDSASANEAQTTNARIIGRLMNNVRMGYYPTCTENLAHIVRGISIPEGVTVNILDPCCGCGIALNSVAEGVAAGGNDCKTYGIELDSFRAEEALTRIDRVGFGSFYYSRISNEAFHAMLLNPPYLSVMTEGGSNTRSEKRFLVDSISNLMMGGLLIYIIPYYRLTADICRLLCDNFNDIRVLKFTSNEFKKFKQVAVLGTRVKRRDGSDMVSALSALALSPDTIPEITKLQSGYYQLPSIQKEVALFKGAQFNVAELAEQLNKSKSFSRLFQRSELDKTEKRPLLPLSIGQIGLVGGSGLINGLVECDTPHIIKGRIVKEKRVRESENFNGRGDLMSTTLTEVISNKLIFNLLTPNGFRTLTDYGGGAIADNICLPLGRVVITREASEALTDYDINSALQRHRTGDWGDVSESDWESNNNALKHGERILSSYSSLNGENFWIITESDRSYTTVLLPDEY
ncbi:MAG: DUF6094 domain-containing protein [Defluviitaleaceae bacterium]|nr:DUF6094 domain-containing protein [Defluviitaleaceae bacterium]